MVKFISIILSAILAAIAFSGIYFGAIALSPSYDTTVVKATVLDVTPVGHKRSTGYVTKLKIETGETIFKEFRSAPTSEQITLYKYYDKYTDGGKMSYSTSEPNAFNAFPKPIAGILAGLAAVFAFGGSLRLFNPHLSGGRFGGDVRRIQTIRSRQAAN